MKFDEILMKSKRSTWQFHVNPFVSVARSLLYTTANILETELNILHHVSFFSLLTRNATLDVLTSYLLFTWYAYFVGKHRQSESERAKCKCDYKCVCVSDCVCV